MTNKTRSGGIYCEKCKKCICQPRIRKNWRQNSLIICEECHEDVLSVAFCPAEGSIKTIFKIRFKDVPRLIEELTRAYSRSDFLE